MFVDHPLQILEVAFVSPYPMLSVDNPHNFTMFFASCLYVLLYFLLIEELYIAFVPSVLVATEQAAFEDSVQPVCILQLVSQQTQSLSRFLVLSGCLFKNCFRNEVQQ